MKHLTQSPEGERLRDYARHVEELAAIVRRETCVRNKWLDGEAIGDGLQALERSVRLMRARLVSMSYEPGLRDVDVRPKSAREDD
jgi:hypothetical protein